MHIIGIKKFCIYQIVKEVDFFKLKRSYNPFKACTSRPCSSSALTGVNPHPRQAQTVRCSIHPSFGFPENILLQAWFPVALTSFPSLSQLPRRSMVQFRPMCLSGIHVFSSGGAIAIHCHRGMAHVGQTVDV